MKVAAKYDKLVFGLVPGLLLPMIAFIATWMIISDVTFGEYMRQFRQMDRLSSLISLSAIPNLLLFFVFIWLEKYRAARGVIFATLLLALIMVILKFF
jgi:hypothetical protein